ncbi:glycoside hydrolase [Mollisia scopiformis]|uniref:Probable glucan endo-1,3-beta-glucosidase eglC n=1 Tax=Mollisia scopiformis TaxID=149040 RepID=A0A132BDR8_MOLSC|nr:glycoside hydrolase [Mollisia scopiformis]KUJ10139.1 glycoside hydrolase [Mollisia scopiformis]
MRSFILGALLPALTWAAPAAKRDDAEPTLMTFTFAGELVTATYYGTATSTGAEACPTETFTYDGAVITVPYTGPGTPQSCLTAVSSAAAPCPTETFTYEGVVITVPYTGPGTPQSCLTSSESTPTSASQVESSEPSTTVSAPTETSAPASVATSSPTTIATGPGDGGPSVATSDLVSPTTSTSVAASTSSSSSTVAKGFNYGSSGMTQSTYVTQFNLARDLIGTSGFTSARLYTSIQDGTTAGIISAIPAAIATKTYLLLGLFYPNVDNEIAALTAAIDEYGTDLADLVLGISVGSEDLYRDSVLGINANEGTGATPDELVSFIQATRNAIAGTALSSTLVGHVDTWNSWTNASNAAVITVSDFIGMDAYPYYQTTDDNVISNGQSLFETAYDATVAVAGGKPVWITETGWPVFGSTEANAVASTTNAEIYWQQVGCGFAFDKIPTFWYDLVDEGAVPSFGVTDGTTTPLYDLTCSS